MGDLCSVDQVKEWAAITGTADDSMLTRVVSGMSAGVQNQLNRNILRATYAETRNGDGKFSLMVMNDPIVSVASVTVNGVAIAARASVTGAGFTFDADTIYLEGACFTRGHQNVVLAYDGGYAAVPFDLAQAVIESIAFLYRERERIGLSSKAMAGETTAYMRDIPPHLMRRIMAFARTAQPV